MDNDKNSQLFLSLIYSFQMQTWMHLGKLKNPVSDKIEGFTGSPDVNRYD
jgi:hypothetical protein